MREPEGGIFDEVAGDGARGMDRLALETPDRDEVVRPHRLGQGAEQVEQDAERGEAREEGDDALRRRISAGTGGRGAFLRREAAARPRPRPPRGRGRRASRDDPREERQRHHRGHERRADGPAPPQTLGTIRAVAGADRRRGQPAGGPGGGRDPGHAGERDEEVRHHSGTASAPSSHSSRTRGPRRPSRSVDRRDPSLGRPLGRNAHGPRREHVAREIEVRISGRRSVDRDARRRCGQAATRVLEEGEVPPVEGRPRAAQPSNGELPRRERARPSAARRGSSPQGCDARISAPSSSRGRDAAAPRAAHARGYAAQSSETVRRTSAWTAASSRGLERPRDRGADHVHLGAFPCPAS